MKFTTLLVAAAALAAGIMVSHAQVYSQNVVGYANVPTSSGGTYAITVPFKVGVSNGANEVWPLVGGQPSLPDFSEVLIWNGTGYNTYFSDSTSGSLWDDQNQNPIPNAPLLPVGQGFFLIPGGNTTNTFVGTVAVNVGTSNVVSLASGGTYLVAPAVPYGGSVTNGSLTTGAGGPNLWGNGTQGLPDFSELLVWNGTGYATYFSDSTSPSLWDDQNQNPIAQAPTINVGQGFFVIPGGQFNWTVGL
jgi:hypothetical protein